jgi:hypothetical protein
VKAKRVVSKLLEDDPIDPKSYAAKVSVNKLSKPVLARIISDETGQSADFDAREGLNHCTDAMIEELRSEDFKTCEVADRVADYGGTKVNYLQSRGPYEVYIDAAAAEEYIPFRVNKYAPYR